MSPVATFWAGVAILAGVGFIATIVAVLLQPPRVDLHPIVLDQPVPLTPPPEFIDHIRARWAEVNRRRRAARHWRIARRCRIA